MTAAYDRLKTLLRELFQLDQADLDFGIYRILHARKAEIDDFLVRGLPPRVKAAFGQFQSVGYSNHQDDLNKAIAAAKTLGIDPESLDTVKELRAKLTAQPDLARLEYETYDHLWRFFSRYYSDGDFLSKRVYREGTYAIPYDGSEVVLHWANKDQYYIKTSEYLRDYAFRLRPDDAARPMRVHFRLVDAQEGAHNNVKAGEDQARVFILAPGGAGGSDFLAIEGDDLVIRFAYRVATLADGPAGAKKPPKQKELVVQAVERVLTVTGDATMAPWIEALAGPAPTEADPRRSVLAKHLDRYVKRNTFDYFIHKDLGGFLRRELDHYLKTEVMRLDDIDHADAPRVEQYLATVKVIRQIARAIIDFLAQVEDFQKKLWLKKKFVTGSRRLVRLDLVPDALLPQVCANVAQRQAWVKLHGIDRIAPGAVEEGYSEPLTPVFLRQQTSLMVDTGFFDVAFGEALCEHLGDLDDLTDGTVLHSENFQALSLMQRRYAGQVQCVYIDPPYNTGNDGFVYRDAYQKSSWSTMIRDRLEYGKQITSKNGTIYVSIDDRELSALHTILSEVMHSGNFIGQFVWKSKSGGANDSRHMATDHEYVVCFGKNAVLVEFEKDKNAEVTTVYNLKDDVGEYALDRLDKQSLGYLESLDFPITGPDGKVYAVEHKNPNQKVARWRWGKATVQERFSELVFKDGFVYTKNYKKDGAIARSLLIDERFGRTRTGKTILADILGKQLFENPKPPALIQFLISLSPSPKALILDYFAGSGTTAHAVINLNRTDGGRRKFILTEMADYCETVLIPRIQKVTYTPAWKDGKPERPATAEEAARGPRVVLVQRLESYEDTLNNLDLRRDQAVQQRLDDPASSPSGPLGSGFRDQYLLRYHLDLESRGSASLLNASAFLDPLAYQLAVTVPGGDERRSVTVDLIETFTWLLGLRVHRQRARQVVNATLIHAADPDLPPEAPRRLVVDGPLRLDPAGPWWFKSIDGTDPEGRRVLVIWRNRPGGDTAEGLESDNAVLNAWIVGQGHAAGGFHRIYVNGDHQIENLRQADQTWTVRLIDTDFPALMFSTAEGGV
jgi:adenine-specific DNA-methyltransferase